MDLYRRVHDDKDRPAASRQQATYFGTSRMMIQDAQRDAKITKNVSENAGEEQE
jgi:hypothetical protein